MPIAELGRVEAGEPFVEQQQLRIERQRARKLEPLLVDVGELRRRARRPCPPRPTRASSAARPLPRRRAPERAAAEGEPGHRRSRGTLMESARARAGRCARRRAGRCWYGGRPAMSLAVEADRAGVRAQRAGDQVEHRRLARAVRADQPEDLAALDREARDRRRRPGRRSSCAGRRPRAAALRRRVRSCARPASRQAQRLRAASARSRPATPRGST